MWIWRYRRVDSVVFLFCTKFASNICYSHWDRHTYASDLHLMTSRELTSGFDFWSRGHLWMAVMHLPMKLGADIFIPSEVIDIFLKFKMAAATSWICLGEPCDHPRSLIRGAYLLYKFCHDRLGGFQFIRIWIWRLGSGTKWLSLVDSNVVVDGRRCLRGVVLIGSRCRHFPYGLVRSSTVDRHVAVVMCVLGCPHGVVLTASCCINSL